MLPRRDDLTDEDEVIINSLVIGFTARQLAEELVRRCGCTFDHRLPDRAPAVYECGYHREMQRTVNHPLTADELDDLIDLIERMVDGEPRNPDVMAWLPVLTKLRGMREAVE